VPYDPLAMKSFGNREIASCWNGISVGHGKYIGKGGLSRDDEWPIRDCGIWPSAYNGMFNMY
jgi:hypothetical protein